MTLKLPVLRHFVQVAEFGSISRAARALNMVQPALSQQIAGLEAELGVKLFARSPQGVTLTPAGVRLRDGAYDLLARARELQESLSEDIQEARGEVRLGLPAPAAVSIVPALVQRLRRSRPGIRLHIEEAGSPVLFDGLLASHHDLIVTAVIPDRHRVDATPLMEESFCLVGAPDSDLGETVSCTELAARPLVRAAFALDSEDAFDRALARAGIGPANVVAESNSLASTKLLVARSDLYGIIAWSAVADDVAEGRLRAARIVEPELKRRLYLAQLQDRSYSLARRIVAEEIRAVVTELEEAGRVR